MIEKHFPKAWIIVKSSDFVIDPKSDIVDGPFGSSLKASEYIDTGVPIARIQNVKRFNFVDKNIKFVSREKYQELQRHNFINGDILITKLGDPLGLACDVPEKYKYGIIISDLIRLRPNLQICSKSFLIYLLNSEIVIKQIEKHVKGTTRPRINLGTIRGLTLPLPPLAEQKIIANKLDTLLAQVEATKTRLQCIPGILNTFRQSVLVAAVSGKLTEKWRDNNNFTPVHETLTNIETARQQVITGTDKKAQVHLNEEEYAIPSTWQWVSLDSLSKKITDGTHHTPSYTESGIHFISVKDIRNGIIDFSNTKFISEKEHLELSKRCPVEIGDLLITKSGTIGRTAIVKTEIEFSLFVSVALIKPASNEVNTKFIDISLQKWVNEIDISSRIVGSAIKNLHLRDMKVLAIPFAPKEEQIEIVRQVEELFAFSGSLEQKVNAALDHVNNLSQSILAKAFRGELTAEWREDNPALISGKNSAEALLARMKAERETTEKQPKLKRTTVKNKTGSSHMSKQIIKVVDALKQAGEPLSGQQLLKAAGYPNDSSTEKLEQFFLDIRNALAIEKSIVKLERDLDSQDWFTLANDSQK